MCITISFNLQAQRSNVVVAAADRPIWYPGNTEVVPEYLDGTLAGMLLHSVNIIY